MTTADGPGVGVDVTEQLYRRLDELDASMRESTKNIERAQQMSDVLAGIVGSAETDDGFVRVECNAAGVSDLTLNPRAMRMVSEDLAASIRETIDAASADYRKKTLEALQEAGIMPSPEQQRADIKAATAQLGQAQQELDRSLREAAAAIGTANRIRQQQAGR
ncbi:hypothetical protein [Jatrophihabitans fulvus]